ncbi:protein of unknown function [Candidatus Bipolaricaulis anaerobius]|uniref:Uncharacterized protein n=1 Tax=Candidatus Bipolaricaulis anaerobius TaxID=2026885 RepID=A0A2X3KI42_9BACT|nr:protein of unknown function [Candidatus Bipolaricaulis anaerobius]
MLTVSLARPWHRIAHPVERVPSWMIVPPLSKRTHWTRDAELARTSGSTADRTHLERDTQEVQVKGFAFGSVILRGHLLWPTYRSVYYLVRS